MDVLALVLSLLVLAGLFWLHRRAVAAAYQAGWNDGEAVGQQCHYRHGLRPLPFEEGASWRTDN